MSFVMKVTNIIETRVYELTDKEKAPVIKNQLVQECVQLIKTFTCEEKGKTQNNKLILWHNISIISLQYHKLHRKCNESGQ